MKTIIISIPVFFIVLGCYHEYKSPVVPPNFHSRDSSSIIIDTNTNQDSIDKPIMYIKEIQVGKYINTNGDFQINLIIQDSLLFERDEYKIETTFVFNAGPNGGHYEILGVKYFLWFRNQGHYLIIDNVVTFLTEKRCHYFSPPNEPCPEYEESKVIQIRNITPDSFELYEGYEKWFNYHRVTSFPNE
jgi:hypothetical protein